MHAFGMKRRSRRKKLTPPPHKLPCEGAGHPLPLFKHSEDGSQPSQHRSREAVARPRMPQGVGQPWALQTALCVPQCGQATVTPVWGEPKTWRHVPHWTSPQHPAPLLALPSGRSHRRDLNPAALLHLRRAAPAAVGLLPAPAVGLLLLHVVLRRRGPSAHHLGLRTAAAVASRYHLLLERGEQMDKLGGRALVASVLDLLDLNVLLRVHAAVHGHDEAVRTEVELIGDVHEASGDVETADEEASAPDDAIVARRVLPIEPGLDHVPVRAQRPTGAAARLDDEAILVLGLTEGPTRAKSGAANVGLTCDLQ
mmetsp:Transcript_3792/g.14059  ORF Transcript_3792/g.14059 Transcript_3792/m.14059 type:complete len:311 (+) Transcript_3792:87-1019(+)